MEAQSLLVLDLEKCTRCDECVMAAPTRTTASRVWCAKGCASTSTWSPPRAASAAIRCAWSAVRSARSAGEIRSRSSSKTGASAAGCARATARTATSPCTSSPWKRRIRNRRPRKVASTRQKATGCDLCTEHEEPSCVYACPHDAAHRVEPLTFFAHLTSLSTESRERRGAEGSPQASGVERGGGAPATRIDETSK